MTEPWEILFNRALIQLKQGCVSENDWVFGGGTALKHKFNHRESKDIDIFFTNPQFLNSVSPRINDGVEANLIDYSELAHHIRLHFQEGEIDFIVSPPITQIKPELTLVLDSIVNMDHPVEIVAKKIYHRADTFKPRDVFDLAVVYNAYSDAMLRNAKAFAQKLPVLAKRIDVIEHSGELEKWLSVLTILSGGEKIRGREVELCRQFIHAAGS